MSDARPATSATASTGTGIGDATGTGDAIRAAVRTQGGATGTGTGNGNGTGTQSLAVFVCRGTRGDVGAIVSVAARWAGAAAELASVATSRSSVPPRTSIKIKIITHRKLLAEEVIACALRVHGMSSAVLEPGEDLPTGLEDKRQRIITREDTAALAAHLLQECAGASIIVYNLFALEGHALAERLGVPGVAASPFVIDRAPPTAFAARLEEAFPSLMAVLRGAGERGGDGCVSYQDVDHWMWRLFLDDVGDFRHALALPPCPLLDANEQLLQTMPKPTTLLVGASPTLVTRAAYWPPSVRLCGHWSLDHVLQQGHTPPDIPLMTPAPAATSAISTYLRKLGAASFARGAESVDTSTGSGVGQSIAYYKSN